MEEEEEEEWMILVGLMPREVMVTGPSLGFPDNLNCSLLQ
jgi:hypothetical protein